MQHDRFAREILAISAPSGATRSRRLMRNPLDESFPDWVATKVVEYITTQHRQPKYILLGRTEFITLRQSHDELAYVLSVEAGERWYFHSVLILEIAQDSFLDVVG